MRVTVVIPTYNGARTVAASVESVLAQTLPPLEILVLDDGSTDDTVAILQSFEERITLLRQENGGVATARNSVASRAKGDLIAFLDHDDLWHPEYLAVQRRVVERHPEAVASFTGHINFYGYESFSEWPEEPGKQPAEVIEPLDFLTEYCARPGRFASVSYMCVPKRTLVKIGAEPFRVDGADDSYLCTLFPLLGPVAYTPMPLVAYRFTEEAQSSDSLKMDRLRVDVLSLLEPQYREAGSVDLISVFEAAFASKERQYAKRLLGVGETGGAREQLRSSLARSPSAASFVKSAGLGLSTYLPKRLQPRWPGAQRRWNG